MQVLWPAGRQARLSDWTGRGPSFTSGGGTHPFDRHLRFAAVIAREPAGPPLESGPHRRVGAAVMRYEIFPSDVIRGVLARAPVELGDTVGIEYLVGAGLRLFFAARVFECFDGEVAGRWRTGFSYRTLRGHPETGEETFSVEKDLTTGEVSAVLSSWSRPGLALTWLGAPVMRLAQRRASNGAIEHLRAIACR